MSVWIGFRLCENRRDGAIGSFNYVPEEKYKNVLWAGFIAQLQLELEGTFDN